MIRALVVLLLFAFPATAHELPYACRHMEADKTSLTKSHPKVLWHETFFRYGPERFPLRTYSLSDQIEHGDWCLRYEVENTGEKDIRHFYWEIAGISVHPFRPGVQNQIGSAPIIRYTRAAPAPTQMKLSAFENADAETRALHIEGEKYAMQKGNVVAPKYIARKDVHESLPAFLKSQGLSTDPIRVVNFVADAFAKELETVVYGPGFELSVTSYASRKGGSIGISTRVVARGEGVKIAKFLMPALEAMEGENSAKGIGSYTGYVERFKKQVEGSRKFQPEWTYARYFRPADLDEGGVYVVSHPITVQAEGASYCYRVTTFSSFAVDWGMDKCAGLKQ